MSTSELAPQALSRSETRAFSSNARFYAPPHLRQLLRTISCASELALVIDVDALERTALAGGDRVMTLALDALSRLSVQVVLMSRNASARAALLRRSVPKSSRMEADSAMTWLRRERPSVCVIAISDDQELLATLGSDDRGIALATNAAMTNVVSSSETSVRAALWWLVDQRTKAGMAGDP